MNIRPSITQPAVAPYAGRLIQATDKTKIQTQSSAGRITTLLSLTHQRKNKQKPSTNLTLYEAYTNHWTKLRRTETKRKKEFNLEAWGKETSNTVSLNKNNEKAEKYCTNEETNLKHRSPKVNRKQAN